MTKEGFIIYKSYTKPLSVLSDEQLGRLFRYILNYQNGDEVEPEQDILPIFLFIQNQFVIDNDKYRRVMERNTENIRKRWNTKNTSGKSGIPKNTKNTDKDKDKEKDKEKDKDKDKNIEKESAYADKKKTETVSDSDSDERRRKFQEFMRQFPTVQKMKNPLTMEQYIGIVKKYGRQEVDDMLAQMENRNNPPVTKAYQSANLTLQKWLRNERERNGRPSDNPVPYAKLGVGERIINGKRTYGDGSANIPMDAPPRPGDGYYWNKCNGQWAY